MRLRSLLSPSLIATVFLVSASLVAQTPSDPPTAPAKTIPATPPPAPGSTPDHPVRVSNAVTAALLVKHPSPPFHPGYTGAVVLQILIDPTGRVVRATAMSGPVQWRDEAQQTLMKWTYKPYVLNGQPAFVLSTVTLNYSH